MKKNITLEVNETYSFELESHAGGGYTWNIVSNNQTVTEVVVKPTITEKSIEEILIGKSFPIKVKIKAIASGKSMITLEEKREWEKNAKPLNIRKLNITVK